jgi:hypothetical protein
MEKCNLRKLKLHFYMLAEVTINVIASFHGTILIVRAAFYGYAKLNYFQMIFSYIL